MIKIFVTIVLFFLTLPCICFAESKTIFANHKYVMGDNDSRNDARRMCLMEAKRKILEKAGTYISTETKVENYQLTKDEISAYSAALIKVAVIKEKWNMVGENMAVVMHVKAEVDKSNLEKQLANIKKNVAAQNEIKEQEKRLKKLEQMIVILQKKQKMTKDSKKVMVFVDKRNMIFQEIDDLHLRKNKILSEIKAGTRNAIEIVERGMTKKEVISFLGPPRVRAKNYDYFNYGKVWVIIEDGIVACVVDSFCYDVLNDCSDYSANCIRK